MIHLNNAGAALPPAIVTETMLRYLQTEAQMGGYETADQHQSAAADFYAATATLLHTQPLNIAFTGSATDAYARALCAIPFKSGDIILTTNHDYVSNQIAFMAIRKRYGVEIHRCPDCPAGGFDPEIMLERIRTLRPLVVAVTHVPTNSGLVQPVERLGTACRENGAWYLVDACQSAGQIDLDVSKIGCDFLTATMRKYLRGPRGAGFLFASDRVLEAGLEMPVADMFGANWTGPDAYEMRPDAGRFEFWEKSYALLLGSAAAVRYALQMGMPWIESRVTELAARLRSELSDIPGVEVLDRGERRCGIVTAHAPQWQMQALLQYLKENGVNARASTLAVAQIDFREKQVEWALRLSPHYYNTEAELTRVVELLRKY
jgi:selenocysteine lyase/cysteine desulfurase